MELPKILSRATHALVKTTFSLENVANLKIYSDISELIIFNDNYCNFSLEWVNKICSLFFPLETNKTQ